MLRTLPLLAALGGCTFYISGGSGSGDAQGGSDAQVQPDALVVDAPDPDADAPVDAPVDAITPPLADAPIDSLVPPLDVIIPPFDAFVPPDVSVTTPLETLIVPCTGQIVVSQLTYSSALNYRVRASGQCEVDEIAGNPVLADAEYYGTIVPRNRESGVDVGIGLYDTTLGFDKTPSWGSYRTNHVYEITGPGFDVPVTARFHDKANNAYNDNSGSLTVEIFAQ